MNYPLEEVKLIIAIDVVVEENLSTQSHVFLLISWCK